MCPVALVGGEVDDRRGQPVAVFEKAPRGGEGSSARYMMIYLALATALGSVIVDEMHAADLHEEAGDVLHIPPTGVGPQFHCL